MFARKLPSHLVPGLTFVIDQYLQGALRNLKAREDMEVVILAVEHPNPMDLRSRRRDFDPNEDGA